MTEAVDIREARSDEPDRVAELLVACYEQYAPPPASRWRKAWEGYQVELADVKSRLDRSTLIVAEADGRLVGTVTFYPPRGEEQVGEGWPAGWASIRLLGVHPLARGRSIGRALTEECLRRARALGAPAIGLHTTAMMNVAREMYERMGFRRVPEHDIPVAPGIVAIGYRFDL